MRSRDKGNRLERAVMPKILLADGVCPTLGGLASSTGRVGHLTELRMDGFSRRMGIECKNREGYPDWPWKELDNTDHTARAFGKLGVHIIKKNHQPPICLITLDTLLALLAAARPGEGTSGA